ncbi:recombinase family protein [Paenibacillus contaminans]|uniref:Recombinase family protein n=1 Tax=Paenibacillus contaminans TaxID=450362 RepID=A0A329MQI3_9BACL|nr:recombinase family protein [Paenibacillus contaminans]RAV22241.1 recombinase family protein [Paenibacillus contaminans]
MNYKLPEGEYSGYLRKSRVDIEAEARGEEDTYARHERILLDLAKRYGINLTKIYREKPVSGEKIDERPEMMKLLEDVEDQHWKGVLVVEVERLARGDTKDQGIVAQAFKYSETTIVTPMRVYNPNNPDDEEYFEFGLFMSRREFKTITRRLQGGRIDGVKEGRYLGNKPPYGYSRVKLPGKGYTLEPHPDQAPIVQLIYSLYTDQDPEKRLGTARLAAYLNDKQIVTQRNSSWTVATVNGILRNPVYIGRVRWGSRPLQKRRDSKSRPRKPREQWLEVMGMHPPIIDEAQYNLAQQYMNENGHPPAPAGKISNPLASIVKCGICGAAVVLRPYRGKNKTTPSTLMCSTQYCKNVSSYYHLVEERLLESLKEWLSTYKAQWMGKRPKTMKNDDLKLKLHQDMLKRLQNKLHELNEQKKEAFNLVERKVYTTEIFLERSQIIAQEIKETTDAIQQTEDELQTEFKRQTAKVETIPKIEHVLDVYHRTENAAVKNELLKSILEKVTYRKDTGGRWNGGMDKFTLVLYPKLPKEN